MAAGYATLLLEPGSDWLYGITLFEDDGSTPIDLTGYHAALQVRAKKDPNAAIMLALDDSTPVGNGTVGGITLGGALGTIDIYVAGSGSSGLAVSGLVGPKTETIGFDLSTGIANPGTGFVAWFELRLINPAGSPSRLLEGVVLVSPQVVI